MPSTLTIVRQRRHRREHVQRSGQQRSQRLVLSLGFVISALVLVVLVAAALVYADLTHGLPSVEELAILLNPQDGVLLQPTRLFDRTGTHLLAVLAPSPDVRKYLSYDQLPRSLGDATIALTDPDFWRHPGYSLANWQDSATHPTIAQKLVFDLLLWNEPPSPQRAIQERLLAAQVTARYGRKQVLEWYLNSADYGHDAYGAEAAAQLYYGKSATALDLSEAALLAAVGQAPALNPIDAPRAAEMMRQETLQLMRTQGLITADEETQAEARPPTIRTPTVQPDLAPAALNLALNELGKRFDRARLERGGLDIWTTLDYDLQLQAACAVKTQVARLAGDTKEVLAADGSPCGVARLLPSLPPGSATESAAASAVILDPTNGQVLAAVGDEQAGQDGAILASHPAGTMLTPFIYLTGFTRGLNPSSLAWDIPVDNPLPHTTYHGPVRLRIALANDYLPPAEHVLAQMEEESVKSIAESFGLQFPAGKHLLQDDFLFSPLELASANGIFANQGTLAGQPLSDTTLHPVAVLKVIGADHSVWVDWSTPATRPVVSTQLAYLMNQVLSDETARWPSLGHPNPLEIGRPAGAKTGQALDASAGWTAGYTPQRVVVVWSGPSAAAPSTALSGTAWADLAADLWHGLMQYAVQDLPSAGWSMPSGMTTVEVCDPSGLLPTAACPNVVSEVFLAGREPLQADTLYQTFQVNRETGLLATVFTPPELVESRVYMVVPQEAQPWARSAGIVVPPTAYDTVQMPPVLPDAHLTSPSMFSNLGGVIEIRGSASGVDFASYRLEYGQGLNPQEWVQLGSDGKAPVTEGLLGKWDTTGLNGLYAVRLLVLRSDQSVDQAVVQVTLDNAPPQVTITDPTAGQAISLAGGTQLALQAQIDEPFLVKADFYMDGQQIGEFTSAPFGTVWQAVVGTHTFRVEATDHAGNVGQAEVKFTVEK
jgi:membrane peptidoglycan carboxypeptidase